MFTGVRAVKATSDAAMSTEERLRMVGLESKSETKFN